MLESELDQIHEFISVHVSDHSGFHYLQFLLDCLQASLSDDQFLSRLKPELHLTQELIQLYPGHEAIWYHRSVDSCSACCLYLALKLMISEHIQYMHMYLRFSYELVVNLAY